MSGRTLVGLGAKQAWTPESTRAAAGDRVNAVGQGFVDNATPERPLGQAPGLGDRAVGRQPVGRLGTP